MKKKSITVGEVMKMEPYTMKSKNLLLFNIVKIFYEGDEVLRFGIPYWLGKQIRHSLNAAYRLGFIASSTSNTRLK